MRRITSCATETQQCFSLTEYFYLYGEDTGDQGKRELLASVYDAYQDRDNPIRQKILSFPTQSPDVIGVVEGWG